MTLSINQKVLKLDSLVEDNDNLKQNDKIAKKFDEAKYDKIELSNFFNDKFQTSE